MAIRGWARGVTLRDANIQERAFAHGREIAIRGQEYGRRRNNLMLGMGRVITDARRRG
jgi:hypothetical protein